MPTGDFVPSDGFAVHQLPWRYFDELARGGGGAPVVQRLRLVERSRRLLLLKAVVDEVAKSPTLSGPLPSPGLALDLLVRVERVDPAVVDLVLAHPYTGSWVNYTNRVLSNHIVGILPTWAHVGYIHAIAAAAAIRAGLDFRTFVPTWDGGLMLPTLGMARLMDQSPISAVEIHSEDGRVKIGEKKSHLLLPSDLSEDSEGWWSLRRVQSSTQTHSLILRLDDVDPYRGPYGPMPPLRMEQVEAEDWLHLFDEAWRLIVRCLPDFAEAFSLGFDSVVPRPAVRFRTPSASTDEAFGSAIIARPPDAAGLAAILVHEFQHVRLSGLLHLGKLHEEDPRQRYYAPWRDDPRPLGGTLQGVYAFFGVAGFWREMAQTDGPYKRTAGFEFAYLRAAAWTALCDLRSDPALTEAGHRFVDTLAARLGPWQDETVPEELLKLARMDAADHQAGWRIRHLRADAVTVSELAKAWPSETLSLEDVGYGSPELDSDGSWRHSRADLMRLSVAEHAGATKEQPESWTAVPEATTADFAYTAGRFKEAANGYCDELASDPDSPAAWIGLGVSLSRLGVADAGRALIERPELVRAVYRKIREDTLGTVEPEKLAVWIGQLLPRSGYNGRGSMSQSILTPAAAAFVAGCSAPTLS